MMDVEAVSARVTLGWRAVVVQRLERGDTVQRLVNIAHQVDQPAQRVGFGGGVALARLKLGGEEADGGNDIR